jgi:fructose transport system ATP-binding protein
VKYYAHICAFRKANFSVYPGGVAALLSDNGAGKSILIETISGA